MLKADGFDGAILGVGERCGFPDVLVYDYDKCVSILVERDDMDEEEAVEFFDFNVLGAYVGETTPVFVRIGAHNDL